MLKYYQQELSNLREFAKEFSKKHPSAAPLLSAETSDPDVERLLEGVAFLTALLRKKIDDDLPELIHNLAEIIFPHTLRPIPSASIVSFTPKVVLQEKLIIKKDVLLASNPVGETTCMFKTCFDLEVHPLKIESVKTVKEVGQKVKIVLKLNSKIPLSQLDIEKLQFFLGGSFAVSSELFMLLDTKLSRIIIKPTQNGEMCVLDKRDLLPSGFSLENALIPFPEHVFSGFRMLEEYFILPHKFLFWEINGWKKWKNRGNGTSFEIIFEFENISSTFPKVSEENFILYATPVINIFPMEAEPVSFDHTKDKILIRPATEDLEYTQVYEVTEVTGYVEGSLEEIKYEPFNAFSDINEQKGVYHTIYTISPTTGKPKTYIRILYSDESKLSKQTLTVKLLCTNGEVPEKLRLGDICKPTISCPELVTFRNIIPVTSPIEPLLQKNKLWDFLSHLSLNLSSFANVEGVKKLLTFYAFPDSKDKIKVSANLKKIEGIESIEIKPANRLVHGFMLMGTEIELTVRKDSFASFGDLYLFGSVLSEFFNQYSQLNSFTSLKIRDVITGDTIRWKEKIGKKSLI
ncbi:type VI secretion system baseplate subunit TssF [Deferribacter abyssi]|uniref:type VI secretion system baseplate subunit TssF n=1 Tax=Deferribacter abyssi TaxID=213806 RepID=UPI003C1A60CD